MIHAALHTAILRELAAHQSRHHGTTPTLRAMAERCGRSATAVHTALRRLAAQGIIEITSRPGCRLHIIIKEFV